MSKGKDISGGARFQDIFEDPISKKNVNVSKIKPPIKITNIKPFDELTKSTATIMVYTNISFKLPEIFKAIPITFVQIPLTTKHKRVDKKNIKAPYGSIFSMSHGNIIKGATIRVSKKPNKHFLNQLSIDLSLGSRENGSSANLHIMIFKDCLKIAGCKSIEDATEAMMVLWSEYLNKKNKVVKGKDKDGNVIVETMLWSLKDPTDINVGARFIFDICMQNLDFDLGFRIYRESLNSLMNSESYKDVVFMSQFESTSNTNVKIKLFTSKPEDFEYDVLIMPFTKDEPYYEYNVTENQYENKKKKVKPAYITLLVFASSQTILSGRWMKDMERVYKFFVDELNKRRKDVEEVIITKDKLDKEKISNFN
jgi:hypothetical protein